MYRSRIVRYEGGEKLVAEDFNDSTIEDVTDDSSGEEAVLNLIESAVRGVVAVCDVSGGVGNFDVIVKGFETMAAAKELIGKDFVEVDGELIEDDELVFEGFEELEREATDDDFGCGECEGVSIEDIVKD